MKKYLIFLAMLIVFSHSVYANDYIEKIYGSDLPQMTLIGDHYFQPKTNNNVIEYSSDGINIEKIELNDNISNYTLMYKNGVYLLIDRTQELIPSNKLFGSTRNNSPLFFFDENMNLLTRKEFMGYMRCYDFGDDFFYFHFTDSSQYKYDDNTKSFTGKLTDVYYKTENGSDFIELTAEEFNSASNNKRKEFIIANGKHCYLDENGTYYLETDNKYNMLVRENSDYHFYGVNTPNGVLAYKIKYNEKDEKTEQAISYDFLNYYHIPNDAEISSAKRDKKYIYLEIIGNRNMSTEKMYYRVSVDKLNEGIKVRYNDSYLVFETSPVIENDFTLVPMRFLFEQMGAEVYWEETSQTATVKKNDDTISFSIDQVSADVNNTEKIMDVPARLINGKTMIPLRFLSEELGYKVEWESETRTVIISD